VIVFNIIYVFGGPTSTKSYELLS